MKIDVKKVKGYFCPNKFLLIINNEPVAFADSEKRIQDMISYIGGCSVIINDGGIKRILNKYKLDFK